MACSRGKGHLVADDGRGLQQALVLGGSRSMRAASTACTVAGTWMAGEGLRQAIGPRCPDQHPVSTRVRTLSSRKKGLPSVRSISSCLSGARPGSSPRSACKSSSALAGGSGSSRSCV